MLPVAALAVRPLTAPPPGPTPRCSVTATRRCS